MGFFGLAPSLGVRRIVGQLIEHAIGSPEVLPGIAGPGIPVELTHKLDIGRPELLARGVDVLDQEPDRDLVRPELFGSIWSLRPEQL